MYPTLGFALRHLKSRDFWLDPELDIITFVDVAPNVLEIELTYADSNFVRLVRIQTRCCASRPQVQITAFARGNIIGFSVYDTAGIEEPYRLAEYYPMHRDPSCRAPRDIFDDVAFMQQLNAIGYSGPFDMVLLGGDCDPITCDDAEGARFAGRVRIPGILGELVTADDVGTLKTGIDSTVMLSEYPTWETDLELPPLERLYYTRVAGESIPVDYVECAEECPDGKGYYLVIKVELGNDLVPFGIPLGEYRRYIGPYAYSDGNPVLEPWRYLWIVNLATDQLVDFLVDYGIEAVVKRLSIIGSPVLRVIATVLLEALDLTISIEPCGEPDPSPEPPVTSDPENQDPDDDPVVLPLEPIGRYFEPVTAGCGGNKYAMCYRLQVDETRVTVFASGEERVEDVPGSLQDAWVGFFFTPQGYDTAPPRPNIRLSAKQPGGAYTLYANIVDFDVGTCQWRERDLYLGGYNVGGNRPNDPRANMRLVALEFIGYSSTSGICDAYVPAPPQQYRISGYVSVFYNFGSVLRWRRQFYEYISSTPGQPELHYGGSGIYVLEKHDHTGEILVRGPSVIIGAKMEIFSIEQL